MNRINKIYLLAFVLISSGVMTGWIISPKFLDSVIESSFETWRGQAEIGEFNYLVEGTYITKKADIIYINTSYGLVTILTTLNNSRGYKECVHKEGDNIRYAIFSNGMYYKPIEFHLKRDLC